MAVDIIARGMAAGKADLVGGKVPASQLPSYVDEVVEVDTFADLPETGDKSKIYLTLDDHKSYRWTGSTYMEVPAEGGGDKVEKSEINGNIKVDNAEVIVYTLPEAYKNYLDEVTYAKPVISQFNLLNSSGASVAGTYELGTTITIAKIKHYETNITSIDGDLTFNASTTVTPAASSATVALATPINVNSTKSFSLTGTDTRGGSISSSASLTFNRYAYSAITEETEAPTSGTKQTTVSSFASSGANFTYSAGQYLFLYTNSAGKTVQTEVLGQWADVNFTEVGAVTFTQENGVEYTYYAYRVGPFLSAGSAKYKV